MRLGHAGQRNHLIERTARLLITAVVLFGLAAPPRAAAGNYQLNGIDAEIGLVRKDGRGDLDLGELRAPWTLPLPGGSMTLPKGSAIKAEAIGNGTRELRLITAAAPNDIWAELHGVRMLVSAHAPISFLGDNGIPDSITAARDFVARLGEHDIPFAAKTFGADYARVRGEPTVGFHPDGHIRSGWIVPAGFTLELAGNRIAVLGDSLPEFDPAGHLREARIAPATHRIGNNRVELAAMSGKGTTGFHPNGGIASAALAHDAQLGVGERRVRFRAILNDDRLPHAPNPFFNLPTVGNIGFHDNGAVMFGVLAQETAFPEAGPERLAPDQYVFFDRTGQLVQPPRDDRPHYRTVRAGLHDAARAGDTAAIDALIAQGVAVDARDDHDRTALGLAIERGHWGTVQRLLRAGADPNLRDGTERAGQAPLLRALAHDALAASGAKILILLLDSGAKANIRDASNRTPLHSAAQESSVTAIKLLVERGAPVHIRDDHHHETALDIAVGREQRFDPDDAMALYLIDHGAPVGPASHPNATPPLVNAAFHGRLRVVEALREHGADLEAHGGFRRDTALGVAAAKGHQTVVAALLRHGADVNGIHGKERDRAYRPPLYSAAAAGHTEVVRTLLEHGADTAPLFANEGRLLALLTEQQQGAARELIERYPPPVSR